MLWHQVNNWLKEALKRTCNEHFGPSFVRAEYEAAIPYAAAKTPNEGSEFASSTEVFNKTLMIFIVEGFNKQQLKKLVTWFKELAQQEAAEKGLDLDKTWTYKMLQTVFTQKQLFYNRL